MRFAVVAVLGLAASAAAQSSASSASVSHSITSMTSAASSSSAVASSTSTSLSGEALCLSKCGSADICCQASCVNVPCPSQLQANATTECEAKCPQGNGTQEETQQYAACQSSCVSSYFMSTGTAGAAATGSSSGTVYSFGATATGSGSTKTGASGTASSTAQATHNAAHEIRFGAAGAGLLGLFAIGLAL